MKYEYITIVSEIDGDLQAWTFDIEESDFLALIEKYGADGYSVRGNLDDIKNDIDETWKHI